MIFYIFLFTFCTMILLINNKLTIERDRRILTVLTLICLCIISGTRYNLGGSDYDIYKAVYNNVPSLSKFFENFDVLDQRYLTFGFERGYLFLNSFFKTIGFNFFGFTLIEAIFFYSCLYIGLRKYTDKFSLLIIVFLYKSFFYNTFISMRQSITIGLFFIMLHFIETKKPIKYYLCCFLALQFHGAALILFLIYPIRYFKLTYKKLIILNVCFIPTLIISYLNVPVMQVFDFLIKFLKTDAQLEKAEVLINGVPISAIGIFHTLEYFLIMLFIIKFFYELMEIDENAELMVKLFLCLLPLMTLFRNYEILTRGKDYFTMSYGIILSYLCLIRGGRYKNIVQLVTILICAFGFFRFVFLFDKGGLIPYSSYIFKDINILK